MRPATRAEIGCWDDLVTANPDGGHILQTRAWGEFKRSWGWRPLHLVGDAGGARIAVLVLVRDVPGFGALCYAPKGPGIAEPHQLLPLLGDGLDAGFLFKLDPELDVSAATDSWREHGLRPARSPVQKSTATIIVDIDRDEDALLASFKPKCRYNIRLAARRGVVVRSVPVDDRSVDVMYRLMQATQARAGFVLRPRRYFEGYWRLQHANGQGDLLFAMLGEEVLAACFVTHLGGKAWYKDGGSSRHHHELMAPHLLQWEVMRRMRDRGVRTYDLVAVPRPADLQEDHPLYGLYRFKSGFNDHITEFVGTWDLPLRAHRYAAWNAFGERLASDWTVRARHGFFY